MNTMQILMAIYTALAIMIVLLILLALVAFFRDRVGPGLGCLLLVAMLYRLLLEVALRQDACRLIFQCYAG